MQYFGQWHVIFNAAYETHGSEWQMKKLCILCWEKEDNNLYLMKLLKVSNIKYTVHNIAFITTQNSKLFQNNYLILNCRLKFWYQGQKVLHRKKTINKMLNDPKQFGNLRI